MVENRYKYIDKFADLVMDNYINIYILEKNRIEDFIFELHYFSNKLNSFIDNPESVNSKVLFGDDIDYIRDVILEYNSALGNGFITVCNKNKDKSDEESLVFFARKLNNYINRIILEHCFNYLKELKLNNRKYLDILEIIKYEGNEFVVPIEDEAPFNLIVDIIDYDRDVKNYNFDYSIINHFWQEFNFLNLNAIRHRDKLLEARKNELLSRKSYAIKREKDENKSSIQIIDLDYEINDLIAKFKEILSNHIIKDEYQEDINIGFNIIKDMSSDKKNYYLSSNLDIRLGVILSDMKYMIYNHNISEEDYKKLKLAFDEYNLCISLIKEEEEKRIYFEKLSEEYYEDLEEAKILSDSFVDAQKILSEEERSIIESIDLFVSCEIDDDRIRTFINNVNMNNKKIDYNFYYKYRYIRDINKYFNEYNSSQMIEYKELCLKNICLLLEKYFNLVDIERVSIPNEEVKNDIYYLYLDDKCSYINYITNEDKAHVYDEKSLGMINGIIERFKPLSDVSIRDITRKVKDSYADESVRRTKNGNYRVTFIHLNNLADLNIELDRNCYVIIAGGYKKGGTAIYEYTNSKKVKNALKDLGNYIKNEVDKINSENISDEEKKLKVQYFISSMINDNNKRFVEDFNNEFVLEEPSFGRI